MSGNSIRGDAPLDEMADGSGHAKPHWRSLLSVIFSLGHETLAQRALLLDQTFEEEGITAILPGERAVNWRCDPIPLPLAAAEFAALEAGLAQRAQLMELILADLYGPQTLLAEGLIPPELVYGNPAFLRPCRSVEGRRRDRYLAFYAADLLRGPDGAWRVLADRTGQGQGIAYALENRRILGRVVPELFLSQKILQLRPFLEITSEALQALSPDDGAGVALLSGGHDDPMWFEHVLLSRELSISLVESGDLTLRNGQVFLKTLRGLQRIGVLFRRKAGQSGRFAGTRGGKWRPWPAGGLARGLDPHGQRPRIGTDRGARAGRLPAQACTHAAGRGAATGQPGHPLAGRGRGGADGAARPRRLGDPSCDRRRFARRSCR